MFSREAGDLEDVIYVFSMNFFGVARGR